MTKKVYGPDELNYLIGEKGLVIFFYPKASSPGCTLEAYEYNKYFDKFQESGYNIVGISSDPVQKNEKFSSNCDLKFPLISDPEKVLLKKFNVLGKKNLFGKQSFGTIRSTFVLDHDGNTIYEALKVSPTKHVSQILEKIQN